MNREQKLERWAEREITRNINHIILENDDGGILAFGKYDIVPVDQGVVVSKHNQVVAQFVNRRTALSWCVADHRGMLHFGIHIRALDQKYRGLRDDVDATQRKARRCGNTQQRDVLIAKIQHKEWYLKLLQDDLEKCAIKAKYLQLRGFEK